MGVFFKNVEKNILGYKKNRRTTLKAIKKDGFFKAVPIMKTI